VKSLKSRVSKIELSIDVTRLTGEQIRSLKIRRLTHRQKEALDVTQLTIEQIEELGFENMTEAQLEAIANTCDEAERRWIRSLSHDELEAVSEGLFWRWEPGYRPELLD
jgi:hypothetical protein